MAERHGVTEADIADASAYALASGQPKKRACIVGIRAGRVADADAPQHMASGGSADAEAYVSTSPRTANVPLVDFDAFVMAWHECQPPRSVFHDSVSQVISEPSSPSVVFKRPAANSQRQVPVQYVAEEESAIPPPPPTWSQPVPDSQPKWASHAVRTLQEHGHLPAWSGQHRRLELMVWSDCSGLNSGMFALRELGNAFLELLGLDVTWVLYMTCESDKKSREFARLNHDPVHISEKMQHRNFQTGQVHCTTHDDNHDMPRRGVDLYIGTYPCSPFSRRGKRTGFDHPDVEAFLIGLKTIAFIAPAVFVIELGEVPSQDALNQILEKAQAIVQAGVAKYTVQVVRNLTPAWSGYPARRKRLFIIGWRADIDGARAGEPLQSLIDAPMAVEQTFLRFLGLQREVDWSRVGESPTQEEVSKLTASACQCGLDPMVLCPAHPRVCNKCGTSGLECVWRRMLMRYITSGPLADIVKKKRGMVTYLQAMCAYQFDRDPTGDASLE